MIDSPAQANSGQPVVEQNGGCASRGFFPRAVAVDIRRAPPVSRDPRARGEGKREHRAGHCDVPGREVIPAMSFAL